MSFLNKFCPLKGKGLWITKDPAGGTGPSPGPTNTVAPVLTNAGTAMSSTTGAWTGTGTVTYAYQHYRDGSPISGATSATYTHGGVAGVYSCLVTATDTLGNRAAWSNSVTIAAPVSTPRILEDGTARILEDNTPRILEAA